MPTRQRGHGFLWGLLEFNDRSQRVLTHRAFESSSVVSWRIGLDAREQHVRTAFGTRRLDDPIGARCGRLIETHLVISLLQGPLSAVGPPFASFVVESVSKNTCCELSWAAPAFSNPQPLGSKRASTKRSTSAALGTFSGIPRLESVPGASHSPLLPPDQRRGLFFLLATRSRTRSAWRQPSKAGQHKPL
jgi:hypothetical protein